MQAHRRVLRQAIQTLARSRGLPGWSKISDNLSSPINSCVGFRPAATAAGGAGALSAGRRVPSASFSKNLKALLRDYKQLSKLKLSALVVATAATGFVTGSDEHIDWSKLTWTVAGTMGASACANTLNQWWEVPRDALMNRTRNRPLPRGSVSPRHALVFAAVTGGAGVACLMWKANSLTAALGAANIGLYAFVYTPLKAVSIYNTWVGAVVGAIPPLMGWAAARGSLDAGSLALASACYFWQLPHFLSLSWYASADYARGGYAMLSLADATGRRTAACCLRNSLYLMPAGLLAWHLGIANAYFASEAGIMAGIMAITAARFYRNPSNATARGVFRASLLYLPVFMIGLMVHRTPERQRAVRDSWQHVGPLVPNSLQHTDSPATHLEFSGKQNSVEGEVPDGCHPNSAGSSRAAEQAGGLFRPDRRGAVFVAPFPLLPMPPQERQTHQGQNGAQ